MAVIDTNVLLRYLTQDHPEHAELALNLLQRIEAGERSVLLPEGVLVETVQVLSSKRLYDVSREVIQLRLAEIIRMSALRMPNKRLYLRALEVYAGQPRLSFVDAMLVAYAEREADITVVSFDTDFKEIPSINWQQP